MPFILPTLSYNPRTRASGEVLVYYNLGNAYTYGAAGNAGANTPTWRSEPQCAGVATPPSGFVAARAIVAIGANDFDLSIQGDDFVMPGLSPVSNGIEIEDATLSEPIDAGDITINDGNEGDSVEIIALPHPDNDVLLCYDQGLNAEIQDEFRAIPRKFVTADHYVRQRPSNTISLAEFFVCNLQGLSLLRGRDVTIIAKFYPDGGAVPSQIDYFTGVRLNVPREIPQEANDSVQVNASGSFKQFISFCAEPD